MNDLEREYRNTLRRFPRMWRRDHEEALLGVLLDAAEAEGRHRMSDQDRRDLAAQSARLHLARIAPWLLVALAALALAAAASLVAGGVVSGGWGDELLLSTPCLPAPPVGRGCTAAVVVAMPASTLLLASLTVALLAGVGGAALLRRTRSRARNRPAAGI